MEWQAIAVSTINITAQVLISNTLITEQAHHRVDAIAIQLLEITVAQRGYPVDKYFALRAHVEQNIIST